MTKIKLSLILLVTGLLFASFLPGCNNVGNKVGVDEKEVQGLKTRTFFNESGNVEVTIATNGTGTIVALPTTAVSRQNELGDDELACLAKCVKIEDLEGRLNCAVLCPITKNKWQMFTR